MSGPFFLFEESYNIKLVYMSGGYTQIDYLEIESILGVERISWGGVKRLFEP